MHNADRGCLEIVKKPKRWLPMALGWFLITLGVVGLFLPFLQGLLFIALGVRLLSKENPRIRFWWKNIKERFPKLQKGPLNRDI